MIRQLIIVDDDASMRRSLVRWAKSNGYDVWAFGSAFAFLACDMHVREACLILDVGLPDLSGPELKRRLIASSRDLPTIFISGLNDSEIDIAMRGLAATPILRKPFDTQALADAIRATSDAR